jgi:hypothetical protein
LAVCLRMAHPMVSTKLWSMDDVVATIEESDAT